ncbi:YidB family protein [Pantoea brenneri]|uniref:YidB family protein n=1 Tax=Pantoea brenneri TaxID=472694 RepID=UPI0028A10958|nr:YidB family protein [Pantoea brenneri]
MSLLKKLLGMFGFNDNVGQEIQGILAWIEQQGGLLALVNRLRSGEFGQVVNSWLSDEANIALNIDMVEKMMSSEAIQQLANRMGLNTRDAMNLLVKYLPQLVDKASSAGSVDTKADLTSILNQLTR